MITALPNGRTYFGLCVDYLQATTTEWTETTSQRAFTALPSNLRRLLSTAGSEGMPRYTVSCLQRRSVRDPREQLAEPGVTAAYL